MIPLTSLLSLFLSLFSHSTPNAQPLDPHGQDHHARGRVGTSRKERAQWRSKKAKSPMTTTTTAAAAGCRRKKHFSLISPPSFSLYSPLSSTNSQSDTIENVKSKIQDKEGTCLSAQQRRKAGKSTLAFAGLDSRLRSKAGGDTLLARSRASESASNAPRWRRRAALGFTFCPVKSVLHALRHPFTLNFERLRPSACRIRGPDSIITLLGRRSFACSRSLSVFFFEPPPHSPILSLLFSLSLPRPPPPPTHTYTHTFPSLSRHPPGPAAPHLRRKAARGRPHARGLQHPEGVDAAPCAPPARRHHRAVAADPRAQVQSGQDDLPQVSFCFVLGEFALLYFAFGEEGKEIKKRARIKFGPCASEK